jgi:hypothetical protein
METQVATQGSKAVGAVQAAWGAEDIRQEDIIVPKILIMQGLSKMVSDDNVGAKLGEFRDSLDGKLLGSTKDAVEFVPFRIQKSWTLSEEVNGKMEYCGTEPVTPENVGAEWDYEEKGQKKRRDQTLTVFALRPSEIKEGAAFPYAIVFKRTSYTAGRKLMTAFAKLSALGQPAAAKVFALSATKTENEKGTYFVLDVREARTSTKEELAAGYQWYQTVTQQGSKVKVDDADEGRESAPF